MQDHLAPYILAKCWVSQAIRQDVETTNLGGGAQILMMEPRVSIK